MAISPRRIVRFTPCLVLGWGFRGRQIEWRYFRFRQIQDGGSSAILENSNGDISAADCPIYAVFGSRMGFSGSADRMALFPVSPNPRWRHGGSAAILKNSNGDISAADRPIYAVFGSSRMGFSGSADRMALFPISPNAAAILENSNGDISAADRPVYFAFGSRMGFSGSAD